ncbi:MAG: exonuclease domain-containing protein [Gammaproteobacteria bacterium]
MLPAYVLLDLETTGATPLRDRITEIALIRFEHGHEVDRWETLVNPGMPIPPFIQNLTGITDDMVQDAPSFERVAHKLNHYLDGAVLAAHNARFDHGFLKNEYRRMGTTLRQKVICTVKLSRRLYPQHQSHGLDAIMQRHGLTCTARHRAMGDVELLVAYLETARQELGSEHVARVAGELMKGPCLPTGLDAALLDELPEEPGVYLFYGENNLPLYIGKSIDLRSRVMAHFSGDHASNKDMRIGQEIKRVEWVETAGELGALLLESRLIKQRQPVHNRRLRKTRQLCAWRLSQTAAEIPLVSLVYEADMDPAVLGELFGIYRSKRQAQEALRAMAEHYSLCPKALGLERGERACFAFQLQRCKGVCVGEESAEAHYLRLQLALAAHHLKAWPYAGKIGIREHNAASQRTQIHVFEHWCHLATVESETELHEVLKNRSVMAFDLDTYKLLLKELSRAQADVIIL